MPHSPNIIQEGTLRPGVPDSYKLYSRNYGARAKLRARRDEWALALLILVQNPPSPAARRRFYWFYDHAKKLRGNARKTCRYYGISAKTFYHWKKRFDITNLKSLEDRSHRPKFGVLPKLNVEQIERIFCLRSAYPYYSKMKIAVLYEQRYGMKISCWQVQKVIQRYELYPDKKRARKQALRRKRGVLKKRVTKLLEHPQPGYLVSIDTIVVHPNSKKYYILTAIDRYSRLAYVRAYTTHSSKAAADFVQRLYFFMDRKIRNVHMDNGTEFHKSFEKALKNFHLNHYWSRVKTPKDNAQLERFNRTLQEEFPQVREIVDIDDLNAGLVEWQDEYNFDRPHAALGYKTPMEVFRGAPVISA